jgi:hypothetical protein
MKRLGGMIPVLVAAERNTRNAAVLGERKNFNNNRIDSTINNELI